MALLKIEGGSVNPDSIEVMAEAIEKVFDSAFENEMSQKTVRHALDLLGHVTPTNMNTSINNSYFTGEG